MSLSNVTHFIVIEEISQSLLQQLPSLLSHPPRTTRSLNPEPPESNHPERKPQSSRNNIDPRIKTTPFTTITKKKSQKSDQNENSGSGSSEDCKRQDLPVNWVVSLLNPPRHWSTCNCDTWDNNGKGRRRKKTKGQTFPGWLKLNFRGKSFKENSNRYIAWLLRKYFCLEP